LGIAVAAPAFLFLNVVLSPLVSNPHPVNVAIADDRYIKAIPLGLLFGFILPSALTCLPYPDELGNDPKIAAVLLWQAFPILTGLFMGVFSTLLPSSGTSGEKSPYAQLRLLRRTYTFGLVTAAISHIAVVAVSLSTLIAPSIFSAKNVALFSPSAIFVPDPSGSPTPSVALGSLDFLKWDYAVSGAANLIWALAITSPTRRSGAPSSPFSLGNVLLDVIVRTALFGPFAATLTLVWERDEVVLKSEQQKKKN
jgi:hypothetical protein